jgi:hypothetical protein
MQYCAKISNYLQWSFTKQERAAVKDQPFFIICAIDLTSYAKNPVL